MNIEILAVGRMKAGPERQLYDRYQNRIEKAGRQLGIYGLRLIEINESSKSQSVTRKAEESASLLKKTRAHRIVALDENGKDFSSKDFSSLIQSERDGGHACLAFAVGGPDGHGKAVLEAAFQVIRFGSFTWPHQIARVLLAEQIYRSMTILSGHPYHRE